ncbi:MAG: PfaD family polyunsaturated fatty acid/polyketide biosynthesis protein [Rhodospirillales bacterium]
MRDHDGAAARTPVLAGPALAAAIGRIREPLHLIRDGQGRIGVAERAGAPGGAAFATLPPIYPEWLGERGFLDAHRVRFPLVVGEMARGIATPAMVAAAARTGALGFFGAAGLAPGEISAGIEAIRRALPTPEAAWGSNLIHSPNEPDLEAATVELYLRAGVRRVSASAFMRLTPNVVRYAFAGIARGPDGGIVRPNAVFAKVSRAEVAVQFVSPPPAAMLAELVERHQLTAAEAALAAAMPVAEDLTVEGDSGGHTDNRPLTVLLPIMLRVRDEAMAGHRYARPIRVGAAGGLGDPAAVAAAFALGAAYVMTGSVNQSAVESGQSPAVRQMLAEAGFADVIMAPAGDMFEMGVKVQVLRRGTLFGVHAGLLYDLYVRHAALEDIAPAMIERLEREIFQKPIAAIWEETRAYFVARDPAQVARAAADPKHRMALVFRWYLGQSSRWAVTGDPARRAAYQVWCGPAMGAFNAWTQGSFLADPAARTTEQITLNLLEGAATIQRAQHARATGLAVPAEAFAYRPRPLRIR